MLDLMILVADRIRSLGLYSRVRTLSLFLILAVISSSCYDPKSQKPVVLIRGKTMGTTYMIKIAKRPTQKYPLQKISSEIKAELHAFNKEVSTYDPASTISFFNNNTVTETKIKKDFQKLIEMSLHINKISEGAFDITVGPLVNLWGFGPPEKEREVPNEETLNSVMDLVGSEKLSLTGEKLQKRKSGVKIDLSAIAKGYAVDLLAKILEKNNLNNYLVEIGGEVFAKGGKYDGSKWVLGIDMPRADSLPGSNLIETVILENKAMATSGDYRNFFEKDGKKYSHTINPVTGYPVKHKLSSVTVIAKNCATADALATALMVMGSEKGSKLIEKLPETEALFIERKEGKFEVLKSSGWKSRK